MGLKNYPSGDPEFDKWFEETHPQWAAEIKAQIAKDELFVEMAEHLELLADTISFDPNLYNLIGKEKYHKARELVARAKGE